MTGPDYFAAAQAALVKAQANARITSADPSVLFDQQIALVHANATMARLSLDAAIAASTGNLSSAAEVHSEATQARTDALHANYVAWVAAITEGSAR